MSSLNFTKNPESQLHTDSLSSDATEQQTPVEQLAFPGAEMPPASQPLPAAPLNASQMMAPKVTRQLTGALGDNGVKRDPVVIKGSGKKSGGVRPPKGRRFVLHIAATLTLVLIIGGALATVVPITSDAKGAPSTLLNSTLNSFNSKNDKVTLLPEQAATATAVTQDGYDPGNQVFEGVPTPPPGAYGDGNHFFYGQCTYWAAMRYHELTGIWVPWLGNAADWVSGAYAYGWHVSQQPVVGSILVMMPGVQGAGGYGHVAIVESINPDGTVHTSNWNWYAGGGGFATLSYWDFSPGPGMYFVWH
ncbi:CHAP domain-containing protein [Thermosporothrix hazakensis]|jgi:surface antigen|uniref:CHAP domain-containing protein n=1 Tax=Thermosporothrix hazakensis TaxID=644383 RepID=A0A326UDW2_THEHA|nr:CHAP domain-containing protein [Thermosporothrix hazakensis]PZW36658.1 CHAP domain-containing protein [Thermosporothrix hazakensis]GCE47308.1 hypothetical protein KTH_21770 [Thermosporothrix hazakensis]